MIARERRGFAKGARARPGRLSTLTGHGPREVAAFARNEDVYLYETRAPTDKGAAGSPPLTWGRRDTILHYCSSMNHICTGATHGYGTPHWATVLRPGHRRARRSEAVRVVRRLRSRRHRRVLRAAGLSSRPSLRRRRGAR